MKKVVFLLIVFLSFFSFIFYCINVKKNEDIGIENYKENLNDKLTEQNKVVNISENIVKEEYYVKKDNVNIYGYITAPENYKDLKLPTIVFSHGFNGRAEFGDSYAKYFATKGYVVYSFDFVGGNANSRSGGNVEDMSVFTEVENLNMIVDDLISKNFVDKDKFYLLGNSQGGVVSTIVAKQKESAIKAVLLVNPAFVLFDDAKKLFKNVDVIPEKYNHRGTVVGKVYFEKSLTYDIFNEMNNLKTPFFIAQGTDDIVAPLRYSQRAIEVLDNATLYEVDGGSHMLSSSENKIVMEKMYDYLTTINNN